MIAVETNNTFREITDADYERAENKLLLEGLKRSYKERFLFLMSLAKIQASMQKMQMRNSIHINKA